MPSLSILLPGWADEASKLPHPAPLIVPVEVAVGRALGYSFNDHSSIPGAASLWNVSNADTPTPPNLVCADPVHLIAGSDDAQLVPIERLNLTIEESSVLIAELNVVLGDSDNAFLHDTAGQWYYCGLNPTALETAPPSAVEGHPMTAALPRDDAARPWRSLWSEVQMALHGSEVNQARQSRGEPMINSVWFWGGGSLPALAKPHDGSSKALFTDHRFAQGFADAISVPHFPLAACEKLNLAESEFDQHIILDTSLLRANPDFVEQRDLGATWSERLATMSSSIPSVSAELNGLTGCSEVFVPSETKVPSIFSRLGKLLTR